MEITDLLLVCVLVLLTALLGYLMAALAALKRAVNELHQMLETVNQQIGPLLQNIREVAENVNAITDAARTGVDRFSGVFDLAGEIGDTARGIQEFLESKRRALVVNARSVEAGFRAVARVLAERFGLGPKQTSGGHTNGERSDPYRDS